LLSSQREHVIDHRVADRVYGQMHDRDQFDEFVRTTLARFGVEVDELDLEVMRAAERVYGPPRTALLSADLSEVEPENRLDPSRPPSPVGEPRA
jgi:hypothetical protein